MEMRTNWPKLSALSPENGHARYEGDSSTSILERAGTSEWLGRKFRNTTEALLADAISRQPSEKRRSVPVHVDLCPAFRR